MNRRHITLSTLLGRNSASASRESLSPLTKRIFVLSFMSEFIVIYPFYVIMFGERGNVSAAGVGLLLAIWMVVSVLAEVPTGVIADKMSKKWSLALGRFMQLLTFAIWLLVPSFNGYLIGFVVWGVGEAFTSGAFQAYLYESLGNANKKSFGKIYSRSSAFSMFAYTAAYLIAFAVGPRYPLLLILSIAISAVSLWITLSLPTTQSEVEVEIRPRIVSAALKSIRDNPLLRRILFGAIIVQGLMGMLGEYMPAYYQQVGTPTRLVALLMSAGSAAAALLYWWMHHVDAKLLQHQLPIIVGFASLFCLSFVGGAVTAVLGIFLFTRMLRIVSVNNETQIQHHAPDQARATLGSLYSFAGKLLSAGLVSSVGFFAVQNKIVIPIRWSVIITVASLIVGSCYFALVQKNLRVFARRP